MNKISRNSLRLQRKRRVRALVIGTAEIPRMAVYKSLKMTSVQLIDDQKSQTLASFDTKRAGVKNDVAGVNEMGKQLAKICLEKKIVNVVYDRAGYRYHGKVKSLAEGAREGGLKF